MRNFETHRWTQSLFQALNDLNLKYDAKVTLATYRYFPARITTRTGKIFLVEFATPYPPTPRNRAGTFSGLDKEHLQQIENKKQWAIQNNYPLLLLRRDHNALQIRMELTKFIAKLENGKAEPVEGPAPLRRISKRSRRVGARKVAGEEA